MAFGRLIRSVVLVLFGISSAINCSTANADIIRTISKDNGIVYYQFEKPQTTDSVFCVRCVCTSETLSGILGNRWDMRPLFVKDIDRMKIDYATTMSKEELLSALSKSIDFFAKEMPEGKVDRIWIDIGLVDELFESLSSSTEQELKERFLRWPGTIKHKFEPSLASDINKVFSSVNFECLLNDMREMLSRHGYTAKSYHFCMDFPYVDPKFVGLPWESLLDDKHLGLIRPFIYYFQLEQQL